MLQKLKNKLRLVKDKEISPKTAKRFILIAIIFSIVFAIKVILNVERELIIDLAGEWMWYVTIKGFIVTGILFAISASIKKSVKFFKE